MAPAERRFRYWREPLCVLALALYVGNKLLVKPRLEDPASFAHCYLGDVLCLPVCVPVALWLERRLGLRGHDGPPSPAELLRLWALWSLCFEWLAPRTPLLAPGAVGDPWDVVAYAAGGLAAAIVWRSRRPARAPQPGGRASLARAGVAVAVALAVLAGYALGTAFA